LLFLKKKAVPSFQRIFHRLVDVVAVWMEDFEVPFVEDCLQAKSRSVYDQQGVWETGWLHLFSSGLKLPLQFENQMYVYTPLSRKRVVGYL
jgi:hypothetical protein